MPLRTLILIPTECRMKSTPPPKCANVWSNRFSISSLLVTSAGITGALLHSAANCLMVPIRKATGALVSTISAPSCTHRCAVFQAIDLSSKAPKIIPFFPFNRLCDIVRYFSLLNTAGKSNAFFYLFAAYVIGCLGLHGRSDALPLVTKPSFTHLFRTSSVGDMYLIVYLL